MTSDSREINRRHWDERAPAHAASPDYGLDRFVADPTRLSDVIRFDVPRLGDISGLRGLHLQCHIGTDTISLSRLGARMTGLDFSPPAVDEARRLAERCNDPTTFVVADAYDAVEALGGEQFDLVFTGIGALCWLPDIDRWADVVSRLLAPGGRLFVREGHPMLWAIDEKRPDHELVVHYPYFETADPIVDDSPGSYVSTESELQNTVSHSWNHGLGEVVTSLLSRGFRLTMLEEHMSVPWDALAEGEMVEGPDGEWRLVDRPERLPLTYTLQAVKPI